MVKKTRTAGRKSSRKLTVDMEGVQNFAPPPEGDYCIKIAEVGKETGSDSGKDYLSWTFEIAKGPQKGKKLFYNTSLQPQALWNLRGVLEAFGIEVPDGSMDLDLDEIESCEEIAGCTVEHEEYQGKLKGRVVDVFSAQNLEGGEDGSKGNEGGDKKEPDLSREDIMALDEDELGEVNEEHDLGVDLDEIKTLKKKREAIADALEEAAGSGTEGQSGDGDITRDDVMAMDADELQELIEGEELEVDLDDHKTLKKKREAVADALEERHENGDDGSKGGGTELSTDDIMAMDADELAELNESEELEVDLDKLKLLSKKRKAIAEAYEEKHEGDGSSGDGDKVTEDDINSMGKDELAEFVEEHKLKVKLEGTTSKQRRLVLKAAKDRGLVEE